MWLQRYEKKMKYARVYEKNLQNCGCALQNLFTKIICRKNLHISKKCCIFATDFVPKKRKFPEKLTYKPDNKGDNDF